MIIETIVSQHAEESSFLWCLRDEAVRQPHYSVADLARLDDRVEAHLDGLRIAGDAGWEICVTGLEEGDAGEAFTAAVLAFESNNSAHIKETLEACTAEPAKARGLISALGWLPLAQAQVHVRNLLAADTSSLIRVGIAASAIHREHPGQTLIHCLSAKDAPLKARALRAVGELGLVTSHSATRKSFSDDDESCRFWASWSAALIIGDRDAVAHLQRIAEAEGPYQTRALEMAMRRLDPAAAKRWQGKLADQPESLRMAGIGAGALGDPERVPWLIERMKEKPLARVAGEAFSMITGVNIAYQDLDVRPSEETGAGPTENPEDENVAMDSDDNLPWPNAEKIAKWWTANQGTFPKGTRHLVGKPLTPDWLRQVLRDGFQRQRAAAALELAILQPDKGLYEVRAPGFRQQ